MPFSIIQISPRRFKVINLISGQTYSTKGLTLDQAKKQLRVIEFSYNKRKNNK